MVRKIEPFKGHSRGIRRTQMLGLRPIEFLLVAGTFLAVIVGLGSIVYLGVRLPIRHERRDSN